MDMTDIGVGLVGYGLGGRVFHAPFVDCTPGMTLRAVVSRDPGKVHADWPGMPVVPSVDDLLVLPGIDLVVVSSPDALHAEHALAAIAAGKHVLIDKPFATTLADARRVADAAQASGRIVSVFHNRRHDADFLTLRGLIAQGALGRIVHFESHFDRWRPQAAPVWKEARDGGSWQDLGPHLVDQALCLFGKPAAVTADIAALRDGAPAPDWFHVVLHYEGMRATLHGSKLAADHGLRFAVHGTGGSWIKHGIDPQEPAIVAGVRPGDAGWGVDPTEGVLTPAAAGADPGADPVGPPVRVANRRGDYRALWSGLAAAIHGEGANPVPLDEALAVMDLLDAAQRSAAERRTIDL